MKPTEHEKQTAIENRKNIAAISGAQDAESGCAPDTQGLHYPDVYMIAYTERKRFLAIN